MSLQLSKCSLSLLRGRNQGFALRGLLCGLLITASSTCGKSHSYGEGPATFLRSSSPVSVSRMVSQATACIGRPSAETA